jgi:hypothetical protein
MRILSAILWKFAQKELLIVKHQKEKAIRILLFVITPHQCSRIIIIDQGANLICNLMILTLKKRKCV